MLSKYYKRVICGNQDLPEGNTSLLRSALKMRLNQKFSDVKLISLHPGGTLGIFFKAQLDNKYQFIKTYPAEPEYQRNLQKEIAIMSFLYERDLEFEYERIKIGDQELIFFRMDFLEYPSQSLTMAEVHNCIFDYQKKLEGHNYPVVYCLENVIDAGRSSRDFLYKKGLLSKVIYKQLGKSILFVEQNLPMFPRILCHGDLSNVNMMCKKGGKIIVIDWEDALIAFPGYDFLYWLTFFSQRQFYKRGLLESFGIDTAFGVSVMALIILVKCNLAYHSGAYRNDSLTFNERLQELYSILL